MLDTCGELGAWNVTGELSPSLPKCANWEEFSRTSINPGKEGVGGEAGSRPEKGQGEHAGAPEWPLAHGNPAWGAYVGSHAGSGDRRARAALTHRCRRRQRRRQLWPRSQWRAGRICRLHIRPTGEKRTDFTDTSPPHPGARRTHTRPHADIRAQ